MWISLESQSQLDQLIEESNDKKVVIFKHSTSCGISGMVKRSFDSAMESSSDDDISFYYLDLLKHRDISNKIASQLDVIHESPQLIVLKDGNVIHDSSHYSINYDNI